MIERNDCIMRRIFTDTVKVCVAYVGAGILLFGGAHNAYAAPCDASAIRYSASSNRVYISGPSIVCTLSEIDAVADQADIRLIDPVNNIWFMGVSIILNDGASLVMNHPSLGGDVAELRLKSNNEFAQNNIVQITASQGVIYMNGITVRSWDELSNDVDTEHEIYRRAFIQARSFLDGSGVPRQSGMNIQNSDIGYLGFFGPEAYGLSWKVNGTSPDIFDQVEVFGDVINSRIHDNFYGLYMFGALGMQIQDNEIFNNALYGIDPHDNSDNLYIVGNNVHNNGRHGIICSRFCDHLVIRTNSAHANGGNGIMLHRLVEASVVEGNDVYDNVDSGIALFDSHTNTIRLNRSHGNSRGIRLSVGSSRNLIERNEFLDNTIFGIYFYAGSDLPTISGGTVRPNNNRFLSNRIEGSGQHGLDMGDSDDNTFERNTFVSNGLSLLIESSNRNVFTLNTVQDNTESGFDVQTSQQNRFVQNQVFNNAEYGFRISQGSNGTRIEGGRVYGNLFGIFVDGVQGTSVLGATIENNGRNGILMNFGSDQAQITGNTIQNNREGGINVLSSRRVNIEGNNITANAMYGVAVRDRSRNVVVKANQIQRHTAGVLLQRGVDGKFKNNKFKNNKKNIVWIN